VELFSDVIIIPASFDIALYRKYIHRPPNRKWLHLHFGLRDRYRTNFSDSLHIFEDACSVPPRTSTFKNHCEYNR